MMGQIEVHCLFDFLMFNINIVILSQYFAFKGGRKNEF